MATTTKSAIRPTPIIRVLATCRVPFGLIPVTAAIATITTAIPRNTSQFMPEGYYENEEWRMKNEEWKSKAECRMQNDEARMLN